MSLIVRPCCWRKTEKGVMLRCYNDIQQDLLIELTGDPARGLRSYDWIVIPESRLLIDMFNASSPMLTPTPEVYMYWSMTDRDLVSLFINKDWEYTFLQTLGERTDDFYSAESVEEMLQVLVNKAKMLGVTRQISYNAPIDAMMYINDGLPNVMRIDFSAYCNRFMAQVLDRSIGAISKIVLGVRITETRDIPKAMYQIDQELDVIGTLEAVCNELSMNVEDIIEVEEEQLVNRITGSHQLPTNNKYFFNQYNERERGVSRYDYTPAIINAFSHSRHNPTSVFKMIRIAALLPTRICMLILNTDVVTDEARDHFKSYIDYVSSVARIVEMTPDALFITGAAETIPYAVEKEIISIRVRSEDKVMNINNGSIKLDFRPCIPG